LEEFLWQAEATVFVSDGGEFGQWAQACLDGTYRLINGPSGGIGCGLPFALAARLVYRDPSWRIACTLGDGTLGFHLAEFDTAVRCNLPFVAVIGNDERWNAEWQLQERHYGADRVHGCELLPTRYDEAVRALGGHGEFVTRPDELEGALERAFASGKPACVNVRIEPAPAPVAQL
jgi:acetolactate synthase-1/2/3 large subunit